MKILANLTLQKRITLLFLSVLAIVLGLFSWLGLQSVNESINQTLAERLTISRLIAKYLDDNLNHVIEHLRNISKFDGMLPSNQQFLNSMIDLQGKFAESGILVQALFLEDSGGRIINADPDHPAALGIDLSKYSTISNTLNTGALTISGMITDNLVQVPVVFFSAPVTDSEGYVIGALSAAVRVDSFGIGPFAETASIGNTGYIEIVDGNGIVLTRTQPGVRPEPGERSDHPGHFAELINQNKAVVSTCHRCHEVQSKIERRRDVLAFAPLQAASWGVAIRQSEDEALAPAHQLEYRLLFIGIFILFGATMLVWVIMRDLVSPLRVLTTAVKRVSGGDFKSAITVKRRDEIGQLSAAFNTMNEELSRSRNELLLRNEELSVLNGIATTVSQSLHLEDVLSNALEQVISVMKTNSGSIFLYDEISHKMELKIKIGPADMFNCDQAGNPEAKCACFKALGQGGESLMVNDLSQCPALAKSAINSFISIPLQSKDKVLGVINVASSQGRFFNEEDFRLLTSIGRNVALAVENSVLYEDARQKEKLRGQLLSRVISAQEEERKRIARELHDEYGQTLTGLVMSIELLESSLPKRSKLSARLSNAKRILSCAMDELRRLTLAIRPAVLDDLGLLPAIRSYIETNLSTAGLEVKFEAKSFRRRLPPTIESNLFRIVQESCHNIVKHAEARHVGIMLERKQGLIRVTIEDDGKGFDVDRVYASKVGVKSLGLMGIQERAALIGGTMHIASRIGLGTTLTVLIPLNQDDAAQAVPGGSLDEQKMERNI